MKCVSVVLWIIMFFSPAETGYHEWRVTRGEEDGQLLLSLSDKRGVAPREVQLVVNKSFLPVSVQLEFPNGFSRAGTSGELKYYWHVRDGQLAVWNHLHSEGRLDVVAVTEKTKLPGLLLGRTVLCVTRKNQQFIGRFIVPESETGWFKLEVEDAPKPILFHVSAVDKVMFLK